MALLLSLSLSLLLPMRPLFHLGPACSDGGAKSGRQKYPTLSAQWGTKRNSAKIVRVFGSSWPALLAIFGISRTSCAGRRPRELPASTLRPHSGVAVFRDENALFGAPAGMPEACRKVPGSSGRFWPIFAFFLADVRLFWPIFRFFAKTKHA